MNGNSASLSTKIVVVILLSVAHWISMFRLSAGDKAEFLLLKIPLKL